MRKAYATKREIYRDYIIAIKFIPSFPVTEKANYERLIGKLTSDLKGTVDIFARDVGNYDPTLPSSFGYFLEATTMDDNDKAIGHRYILLTHETGLEIFLPIVLKGAAGGAAGWATKKLLDYAFPKLMGLIEQYWNGLIAPGTDRQISRVAIRTEHKGVMEMAFSDFRAAQLACLLHYWEEINELADANLTCFEGKLVEPAPGGWGTVDKRSRD